MNKPLVYVEVMLTRHISSITLEICRNRLIFILYTHNTQIFFKKTVPKQSIVSTKTYLAAMKTK